MKYYSVTNNSDGPFHIAGRKAVVIPALCKDHVIALPDATAANTIARLKQMYPVLSFKATSEPTKTVKAKTTPVTPATPQAAPTDDKATTEAKK